ERNKQRAYNSQHASILVPPLESSVNPSPITEVTLNSEAEPMQIGHTRLSSEERKRRFEAKECSYC
ncbi:hypothetical protein AMECASPLE_033996, partial [Ameca splendens]